LLPLLRAPQLAIQAAAASALEWLRPEAATPLIIARLEELEDDPDSSVRYYARNALQSLRPEHLLVSAAG
jgi:HEAT repeat protein